MDSTSGVLINDENIHEFFELNNVVEWVNHGGFKFVALQMSDSVIPYSLNVVSILRKILPAVEFQLLADSTLGNCCTDALSALHVNADALVHFGHSCLFPTSDSKSLSSEKALCRNISVLLVFCRYTFSFDEFTKNSIHKLSRETNTGSKFLLFYDVIYHSFLTENNSKLPENIVIGKPVADKCLLQQADSHNMCFDSDSCNSLHCCRRCFSGISTEEKDFTLIYIGQRDSFELTEITFSTMHFVKRIVVFDPNQQNSISDNEVTTQMNRALGRRLYFVERVRDALSIGLVVSASSAAAVVTQTALDYAKKLLVNRGKKVYIFCVGRLTPTKLAAYTEVDAFVFLGCPERALQVNSSDFYRPVVSFAEMEMACNSNRALDYRFVPDLTELLPGGSCFTIQASIQEESDVSLLSNNIRRTNALQSGDGTESDSFAGERLLKRHWRGLDASEVDSAEAAKAVTAGRRGIPIRYEDEIPNIKH